ncbi:hypothetical protein EZS27_016818 [termite gut metagenome]|uniref:Uncharacterized protein n=1 Tax=termite gut metagenome TaxID=433724 RepID=A0A5J4RMJ9_9ZZZZ
MILYVPSHLLLPEYDMLNGSLRFMSDICPIPPRFLPDCQVGRDAR